MYHLATNPTLSTEIRIRMKTVNGFPHHVTSSGRRHQMTTPGTWYLTGKAHKDTLQTRRKVSTQTFTCPWLAWSSKLSSTQHNSAQNSAARLEILLSSRRHVPVAKREKRTTKRYRRATICIKNPIKLIRAPHCVETLRVGLFVNIHVMVLAHRGGFLCYLGNHHATFIPTLVCTFVHSFNYSSNVHFFRWFLHTSKFVTSIKTL